MTIDILKEKKEQGYKLIQEKYSNGVEYYSISKKIDENTTSHYGEVCTKTAHKISKLIGIELENTNTITIACNFTPEAPRLNMFRYWFNETNQELTV